MRTTQIKKEKSAIFVHENFRGLPRFQRTELVLSTKPGKPGEGKINPFCPFLLEKKGLVSRREAVRPGINQPFCPFLLEKDREPKGSKYQTRKTCWGKNQNPENFFGWAVISSRRSAGSRKTWSKSNLFVLFLLEKKEMISWHTMVVQVKSPLRLKENKSRRRWLLGLLFVRQNIDENSPLWLK